MAEAQGLRETAAKFVRALQAEMTDQDAAGQLELKGWLDGVRLAFITGTDSKNGGSGWPTRSSKWSTTPHALPRRLAAEKALNSKV